MSPAPAPSDTADLAARAAASVRLVERIRAGDGAAEAELVERFGRGVRFVLNELARDAARVDDLYQETFRLVLAKVRAGELREPEKLAGFIRQVARNLFLAERRGAARHPTADLEAAEAAADPAPDALAGALERENGLLVRRLLAGLEPERDRQILFRFYLTAEPKERICSDLGLTSSHFNVVLHRARQRFRALWEEQARRIGTGRAGLAEITGSLRALLW
jgi:RNA polymerase sigma-70 factor (ECF subfamily)